jgi:integrase
MALTDSAVRNAKSDRSRTIKLSDGGGLQLWVQPSGGKLWNLAYRFAGKQRKLAIGPYPAFGLRDARDRREAAKRLLVSGTDPNQQKRVEKLASLEMRANTFKLVGAELLEKKRKDGRAPQTLSKFAWLLGMTHPSLGARPISEIGPTDVLEVLKKVEARGTYETAKRLRATIGEVFRHAIATGRAQGDPTIGLRGVLTSPAVNHRAAIIDPVGLGGLLRAIDAYQGMPEVRAALQLLALTFVRPGEMRGAKWVEFDFERAVWTIPPERMKMRRPHGVPLARHAVQVLTGIRKITGDAPLVFPGARSRHQPLSENTLNAALRRLGFSKDEMTAHGFRAAASSILNESGQWNADAIEAQLAHVEGNAVRRAYARAEYWDERVRMMAWWADKLDALRPPKPKLAPLQFALPFRANPFDVA